MVKRELSCFLCRELLYEFAMGSIDERRRSAVQEHLDSCGECRIENEALNSGIQYLSKLSRAEINPHYLKEVAEPEPLTKQWLKKIGWQKWPDPIKWTVESVVVGGVLAVLIGVVSQKVLLKMQEKEPVLYTDTDQAVDVAQTQIPETPADQLQGTENGDNPYTGNDEEYVPDATPAKVITKNDAVKNETSEADQAAAAPIQKPVKEPSPESAPVNEAKADGFIYRGNINVQDVDTVTPDVVAKIESLNGKRAGEVELGWRQPGGSYFHFSMPENGFNALAEHLKTFGTLNIVKEKNRRVMPRGIIRIILNVNGPRSGSSPQKASPVPESKPDNTAPPIGSGVPTSESESAFPNPAPTPPTEEVAP